MTEPTRAWQLAPDHFVSAPPDTPLARALDLVFGRLRVEAAAAGAACTRLDAVALENGEWLLLVESMPLVRARTARHLPPVVEGALSALAVRVRPDCAVFHAGCVEANGKPVLILGGKGSGKSTLSLWLAARGASYHGDEMAFVRLDDHAVLGFPKAATIKEPSFPLFDEAETFIDPVRGNLRYLQPGDTTPLLHAVPGINRIIVPRFDPSARLEVTPLATHETALMLVQQCFGSLARHPRVLDAVTRLAAVPAALVEYANAEEAGHAVLEMCREA